MNRLASKLNEHPANENKNDLFSYLEDRFELNIADRSMIAQFIHDMKKENTILPTNYELDRLDKSIKAADLEEYDLIIKDLKKQINNITNKVREFIKR